MCKFYKHFTPSYNYVKMTKSNKDDWSTKDLHSDVSSGITFPLAKNAI